MKIRTKTIIMSAVMLLASVPVLAQQPDAPPPAVSVEAVGTLESTEAKSYVGTLGGDATVDIVARVSGTMWKAAFTEGSVVKKGDLLYEIEDTIYKANVRVAEAALKQMEAEYDFAQKENERYQRLLKADATAKTTYDNALRSLQFYEAKIEEAKANLILAQNDLSYTKIYSPINGQIGANIYSAGNYITPATGKLARIVKFDPILINFAISEADFFRHFKDKKGSDSIMTIYRADGKVFNGKIQLDFFDNEIDRSTGTLGIQLSAANPNMELVPGGYVKVQMAEKFVKPMPAIKVTAIMTDGKGHYVYVLDQENTVLKREVVIGRQVRDMQLIESGLEVGDRVIVSGLHKARVGGKVKPSEKTVADALPKI